MADNQRPFVMYYTLNTFDYDGSHMQIQLHQQDVAADVINMPTQGGGYMVNRGNWIIDNVGSGGGQSAQRGDRNIDAGGGEGSSNLGYAFTFFGVLRIYPFVGIGGYGMGVSAEASDENQATDIVADEDNVLLEAGGPKGTLGIGIELRLGWLWGIVLGTRLGYHYLWADGSISRVPYMSLLAGFGRLRAANKT